MRSRVAPGGAAITIRSAPRAALAGVSAISVIAEAFSASTASPLEGEQPTTRGTPADPYTMQNSDLAINNVERVGMLLYTDYLVPFEVASMLLLVAMVGAIILAKREL